MNRISALLSFLVFLLAACAPLRSPLSTIEKQTPAPLSSFVIAGYATASAYISGAWTATPSNDYEFIVYERRYAGHWDTIKEIHFRNPRYDGRAGPRDQTLYFSVRTSPATDGGFDLLVEGTLGSGRGHEDAGSGRTSLELVPATKGWFIPFNLIRITQKRGVGEGRIEEVVELVKLKDGRETPFMRMEEKGTLYMPVTSP